MLLHSSLHWRNNAQSRVVTSQLFTAWDAFSMRFPIYQLLFTLTNWSKLLLMNIFFSTAVAIFILSHAPVSSMYQIVKIYSGSISFSPFVYSHIHPLKTDHQEIQDSNFLTKAYSRMKLVLERWSVRMCLFDLFNSINLQFTKKTPTPHLTSAKNYDEQNQQWKPSKNW